MCDTTSTKFIQPNSPANVRVVKTIWRNTMRFDLQNMVTHHMRHQAKYLLGKLRVSATSAILIASLSVLPVLAQNDLYTTGQSQLDDKNYVAAQETFSTLVESQMENRDAALYWLAYAQFKGGDDRKAILTLETLTREYPSSRWIDDTRALMVEIRDARGEEINVDDEEMKLYALNSLMNSPSERSMAILQKILTGNSSERIKRRALFVLSQIPEPEAFSAIADVAMNSDSPKLQNEAIHVLGISGSPQAMNLLTDIYRTSKDTDLRADVLHSYMIADQADRLIELAKNEPDPKLRKEAIHLVGVMSEPELLFDMYGDASFSEHKEELLQAMAIGDGADQLIKVIQSEGNEELKIAAVEKLGITRRSSSSDELLKIYKENDSRGIRNAVLHAMFMQSNSSGLVAIVKTEKDPELKREAMQKLSMMDSNEALDFFSELLNDAD